MRPRSAARPAAVKPGPTRTALIDAPRQRRPRSSGGSSPWSCTMSRPTSSAARARSPPAARPRTRRRAARTAAARAAMARAVAARPRRAGSSGQKTKPMASAPARAAMSASSTVVIPQIFTATRAPVRAARPAQRGTDESRMSVSSAAAGSGARHQVLADQEGVVAGVAQPPHVARPADAALRHRHHVVRDDAAPGPARSPGRPPSCAGRGCSRRRAAAPAAQRALQLAAVVHLDQRVEARLLRRRVQRPQLVVGRARPRSAARRRRPRTSASQTW